MLLGMDEYPYHQITSTFAGVARIVDSDGRSFEFDHAWAENFTRLTCDGQRGLAHFECVVIQEAQDWTANPGRRPS